MGTPTPEEGEPFAAAAGEAVQTAVMAYRLVMAVADAVRRQQQRQKGEEQLPPAEQAATEAATEVTKLLPPDIATAVMGQADWPQMAQQLVALRKAGVDLQKFLPQVGEIAVMVRDEVAQNAAPAAREGTGQWERLLRETLPAGPVREAILTSPTWPEMTQVMARLKERGVDVREVLAAAYQAVTDGFGSAMAEPKMSRDAKRSYGPLTTGLDLPLDLDLSDSKRALAQLAIAPEESDRYGRWVREALKDHPRAADQLLSHRQWPLLAARMAQMEKEKKPVREHLSRLADDTSWEEGPAPQLGSRLVEAANDALRQPPGSPPSRVRVDPVAARARSVTLDPPKRPAAGRSTAPAEPGVALHRQQAGPAPTRRKSR
ncbi:hypothetical protein [Streptomyces thermogriseus]|uniref:Uncharacterized protein n=1 Tax=Streptomyces thermogriseus TaxID=75292 RepID=A0ABN1T0P1_9ACTN